MQLTHLFRICYLIAVCLIAIFVSAQNTPKLVLPIGHTKSVNFAEFSPDGQQLVTASSDNTAKIWNVESGKLLLNLEGHRNHVNTVKFSLDGLKVLTASRDSTAKIWDAKSGKILINLKGHSSNVISAEFSLDGIKVLTASRDSTVKIWDTKSGKLLRNLGKHSSYVNWAKFSPDGDRILTVTWDSTAKIWDTNTGGLIAKLKGHNDRIISAEFNSDKQCVVTASWDSTAKIWEAISGKLLRNLKGHSGKVTSAKFSPDGSRIITTSSDSTAKIWDYVSGELQTDLKGHSGSVVSAKFSADGLRVITISKDGTAKIWDTSNGKLLLDLRGHSDVINSVEISPDGLQVVTGSSDHTAKIWGTKSGKLIRDLKGYTKAIWSAQFSPDGLKVVTVSEDSSAMIWDINNGKLLLSLRGHTNEINSAKFSPNGGRVITSSQDGTAKIWNTTTGKLLTTLKGHNKSVESAEFNSNGKRIITSSSDSTSKLWDTESGELLLNLNCHNGQVFSAIFSPNDDRLLTLSLDSSLKIWDAITGKLLINILGKTGFFNFADFSQDGQQIIAALRNKTSLWDANSGKLLYDINNHSNWVNTAVFSPNTKQILTGSDDKTAKIWDRKSGKLLTVFKGHNNNINFAEFSQDGKRVLTGSSDNSAKIWDSESGQLIKDLKGHNNAVFSAKFSSDFKLIITSSRDNTSKIWDANTGELLYTFFAIDSTDYLVVDKYYRYDGTEGARKLLYFTCGNEIIELDQLKDQLWVPNLAQRILNSETIEAKKLEDLNICQLTPVVQEKTKSDAQEYLFAITPQRGGLGKTVLYVNDFPIKTYQPDNLLKTSTGYELRIARSELLPNFVAGQTNQVSVRSFIANDSIGSRGEHVIVSEREKEKPPPPNLYAVMIGVSDYKGDKLDLKYAAKDAKDLSAALSVSARKLLNYDGKEHVFFYDLTTSEGKYRLPEKEAIRKLLQEIGSKTKPNDILLLFFAGHGVMDGEGNKQFYFLTADASPSTATENPSAVGISMLELMDWVKLQNVNAQKRILILDACNSGQAIKDFVKLGGNDQGYMAARSDERGQQIKAIDKLNEQTGFFILSASASSQSAYEMGRYSQGLLTYSLLRAIKLQPDILEQGKYLDVSRWFGAAEKTVSDISKSIGQRQDPQRVASNNFNLGVVDEDVLRKIILPQEKPLFGPVNLQNADEAISSDDLELGKLLQYELTDISSRGEEGSIMFDEKLKSEEVWTLSGRYEITNNKILAKINIKQGKQTPKYRFEVNGSKDNLKELSKAIVSKAIKVVQEK
jgi:WD40 repeat protein